MSEAILGRHPAFFGKLPSRGDFVRSSGDAGLLAPLDRWLSRTMELLCENPCWKQRYDAQPGIDFAFLGARSRLSIAGHLMPSRDASQRRFPFIAAIGIDNEDPLGFLSNAPRRLSETWARLDHGVREAARATNATASLEALTGQPVAVDTSAAGRSAIGDFLAGERCGELETRLSAAGQRVDLRRLVIALGLLLQPLATTPAAVIGRGLDLPLPAEPALRDSVATLWLHLIGGFLRRTNIELQILLAPVEGRSRMVIGFQGASAPSLVSVFDPHAIEPHNIRIDDPQWVEERIGADYGLAKLSSYLSQPALPLERAVATFREVLLGE